MSKLSYLENGATCVILNGESIVYSSTETGIRPVFALAEDKTDVSGCVAIDKIVGRAAAFIYAYLGVSEVHAYVMSEGAKEIFRKYGILSSSEILTERIINRRGDDICPMEKAVLGINEPSDALNAVRKKITELRGMKNEN